MPDLVTHVYFSERVTDSLPETLREHLRPQLCGHTAGGPDVWFTCGFYGGKNRSEAPRGGYMHENKSGAFLTALARRGRVTGAKDELFSYLAGYLCHYALDTVAHPYIVYRTGNYDGTAATRSYRGNHTRLERAIDSYVIRELYHSKLSSFPLAKKALPLQKLPESLREDLDSVYREVYGWENAWASLNQAIRDQRYFYRLMQDPIHFVNGVTRLFNNGKSSIDYRLLSYQNRALDMEKVDFLNLKHSLWRHPQDPSIASYLSFPELAEQARQRAVDLITIVYGYIYEDEDCDLPALIGNLSYSTGLDCLDPRNQRPGVYEPLFG